MSYASVLFVCTGNICRSPTADGMLRAKLRERGLSDIKVDSAGTHSYHVGHPPDGRARAESAKRGYPLDDLVARAVTDSDFYEFDLLVGMDRGHIAELERCKPDNSDAVIRLHSSFVKDPIWEDVPDPYYGGPEHFEKAFTLIEQGVEGILQELRS